MCVCIYSSVPFTYLEVKEKLQKINMNETQCKNKMLCRLSQQNFHITYCFGTCIFMGLAILLKSSVASLHKIVLNSLRE